MAGGTHLSIGEVLSLLQEEFPGVTISKIRFLESQGLVDPERTPSGYRKFYEDDIVRLRWVLRQQRDSFLPLKVIRGRLEDHIGEAGIDVIEEGEVGEDDRSGVQNEREPDSGSLGADGPQGAPSGGGGRAREHAGTEQGSEVVTGRLFDAGPPYSAYGAGGAGRLPRSKPTAAGQRKVGSAIPRSRGVQRTAESRQAEVGSLHPRGRRVEFHEVEQTVPTDALTLEELVRAAETDEEVVRDLERYGLILPRIVAGTAYYRPDAVVVCRLGEAFSHHGVEARHLRAYKSAAEREAGVIQQIIMPLIKQRNPKARQEAAAAAEEVAELGAGLRAALLRSALIDLV